MTEEREERLVRDFPELFRNYQKNSSRMYWGFACEDGWFDLLYRLSSRIDLIAREGEVVVEALQVKEKFGGLRFYYALEMGRAPQGSKPGVDVVIKETPESFRITGVSSDDLSRKIHKIVRAAEDESITVCELCGQPGILRDIGRWFQTLCDPCLVLRLAQRRSRGRLLPSPFCQG